MRGVRDDVDIANRPRVAYAALSHPYPATSTSSMPTTIASSDIRSRVYMHAKLTHAKTPDQSSSNRLRRTLTLNPVSETSYIGHSARALA